MKMQYTFMNIIIDPIRLIVYHEEPTSNNVSTA